MWGVVGGDGGELGWDQVALRWKQTPTPNQTQIEIPEGTGCPKRPQARLAQGGGQRMKPGLPKGRAVLRPLLSSPPSENQADGISTLGACSGLVLGRESCSGLCLQQPYKHPQGACCLPAATRERGGWEDPANSSASRQAT